MSTSRENGPYNVIVVVGLPASGKTVTSTRIAAHLRMPLISKDVAKEILFDTLGTHDREWSKKLGVAAYELTYLHMSSMLSARLSFVADPAFDAAFANPRMQALQRLHGVEIIQVHCHVARDVLTSRFTARAASGSRHPGHADTTDASLFEQALSARGPEVLEVDGRVFELDTTNAEPLPALLRELDQMCWRRAR